jgi:dephospho-CoA kinase
LDRGYVARIVFQDPEKLQALNAIVHPAVGKDAERWHLVQKGVPYTLKEAALLFEAGSYRQLDITICVVAPRELRIKRVMERDQVDEETVRARMDKQWPQHRKMLLSDFLLYNDGEHSLIQQVFRIHRRLTALSAEQ